mmetsp:Transcript_23583/g.35065  ORF Transcript_23583/g.35065 Transcript_23583/m.35065 type:complete len:696 (-) Transcript_23583:118-2205(-)
MTSTKTAPVAPDDEHGSITTCTTVQSGSIEVYVSEDNGDYLTQRKSNNSKKAKSKNQLSTMMRRIKNPAPRRRSRQQQDPLVPASFRKVQSLITTRSSRRSASCHSRSSSDFGMYGISDADENRNHEEQTGSVSTSKNQGDDTSVEDSGDILLVASSVSEEDCLIAKSPSDGDLSETSKLQSLYNMVTSSWRLEDDDKENSGGLDNDSQLIRKNSIVMMDGSSESLSQFFMKEDFDSSTWSEVNATNSISIFGAAVMTATVVIHPLVFVAGAATAVWAVGALHAAEKGYKFFTDKSFKDLFWADASTEDGDNPEICKAESQQSYEADNRRQENLESKTSTSEKQVGDIIAPRCKSPTSMIDFSPPNKRHLTSEDSIITQYFPPLEHQIVSDERFPGLNALEFFEVYLADDAPYSLKEFQSTMGDIDIDYGKWERRSNNPATRHSFHPAGAKENDNGAMKFPTSSKKERELNFKTLTKSYFGPAYATARKKQRVTKFSTRLVIIESMTELFDIPYCDRFFVVERWIVEADKLDPPSTSSTNQRRSPFYIAKLSVSIEVVMLRSCNWERQIRQKTLSTVNELLGSWTKKATKALNLAMQKKLERRKVGVSDDGTTSLKSYRSVPAYVEKPPSEAKALEMHQQKLRVIEEKISTGDLQWCNIEIRPGSSSTEILPSAESNQPRQEEKKRVLHRFKQRK